MIFSLTVLSVLYSPECYKDIFPFLLCLLKLKSLFYSENQITQKAETTAASMVVVATAKPTTLETNLGAQEEIATHDQIHITHEKVMTYCWCEIHSCVTSLASHLYFPHVNHHSFTFPYNSNRKTSKPLVSFLSPI